MLILSKRFVAYVAHRLVQHAGIARHLYVDCAYKGHEKQIVADTRAHAVTRRVPPVLNVAFLKLVRGAGK